MDLQYLLSLKESENKVEFKSARNNFNYAGGQNTNPKDRRHCLLGYIVAFCNERGGTLVLGVSDGFPHKVVGSNFYEGTEGKLVSKVYNDTGIRVDTEVFYEG